MDLVTVSLARMTPDPLTIASAAYAVLAAVASNTVSKVAIGAIIARRMVCGRDRSDGGALLCRRRDRSLG